MDRLTSPALIAFSGVYSAVIGAAADQSASLVVLISSLTATLVASVIWIIKQVLGKTLPEMQAKHTAELDTLCKTFQESSELDRQLTRELHAQVISETHANRDLILYEVSGRLDLLLAQRPLPTRPLPPANPNHEVPKQP